VPLNADANQTRYRTTAGSAKPLISRRFRVDIEHVFCYCLRMYQPLFPVDAADVDTALKALIATCEGVRDAVDHAAITPRVNAIGALLAAADSLVATALSVLSRGGIEAAEGISPEMLLRIFGRRTGAEVYSMCQTAATLQDMPKVFAGLRDGLITWGQMRSISALMRHVSKADRANLDQRIADRAMRRADAPADDLIEFVGKETDRCRDDLHEKREARLIARNYLSIQPKVDGGSSIAGEADPESTATFIAALDAAADDPVAPEDEGPTRPQQYFDALMRISERSLAGGDTLTPRPRLYGVFDIAALSDAQRDEGLDLLWGLTGRRPHLSRVSRDMLLCDAEIVAVITKDGVPIAVGDKQNVFSNKVRTAILVRDRRCRMCNAAAAGWTDVHHIVPGRGNAASDGCLLCRRCHRRVHKRNWKLTLHVDGRVTFKRAGKQFTTYPP
jgi:hypothetical protein